MPIVSSLAEMARSEEETEGLIPLLRRWGSDPLLLDLGLPPSEVWAAEALLRSQPEAPPEALDSVPFANFCQSLILPLMSLSGSMQQKLFGRVHEALSRESKLLLLDKALATNLGLSTTEKIGWLTGERLGSRRPWSEERLLALLALCYFEPVSQLRQRMIEAGGIGPLAALLGPSVGAPLATRVVTLCLFDPPQRTHPCWADLLKRCSPLERFVFVSRLAGKLDLTWSGRTEGLIQRLAQHYGVDFETLLAAHALEDLPQLVERLERDGPAGLRSVVLRPLAAFRPALAQSLSDTPRFPCWVDCKYDGIRLLLHKELDALGNMRAAAYTRRRNDWSELVSGLEPMLRSLNAHSLILDGELHGRVLDIEGVARPATVYEVHQSLRGERAIPLRYVAFDLLYCNGQDWTQQPFQLRRQKLEQLLSLRHPQGLPLELAQGSLVHDGEQLNRLYQQYRRQGHEGCMVKDPQAAYPLAARSPAWQKRKPLETVDLVLSAAYWGESSRAGARLFDSYSLAARFQESGQPERWREVGTVAGVDQQVTAQLVAEIWRNQLLTGQDRLRESARGTAQGVALRPFLVVTVAFEDLIWDRTTAEVSLRSPRIVTLRSGEMPLEESTPWVELQRLALRSRLS